VFPDNPRAGFLNLWVTEEFLMGHGLILMGHGLILLKSSRFLKLNVLIENVDSSSATNVTIRSIVTMC